MREDWIESTLNELCEIFPGVGFPKDKQGKLAGAFPFYKVGDISRNVQAGNRFLQECDNYIDKGDIPNIENKVLPPNSITFAKIGEALKLNRRCITSGYSLVDNNAIGVKANKSLNDLYLYFFFLTIRLEEYSRATTVPSVRKSDIENIKIPLASLPEQRAIVAKIEELFSDLDKGIADLKKAEFQLKVYRQAVLKKAFKGEYSEDATIELNRIGEHCKIVSGKAFKKSEYSDSGVRLFQIANVSFNKIVWDKIAHLPESYLLDEKLKALVLKEGDLVMALNRPMLNNELKIGILGKSDVPSILYQRVGKFVFDSNINSKYLGYFFQSPVFIKWLSKELQGVNIPFINQSNLLGFSEFPYVDIELQNQIVQEIESRLSVCDNVEQSISESLEKAKALRQSILKKAFEGTLLSEEEILACKTAPDYEPASVLLEKIKAEKNDNRKTIKKVKTNG